MKIQYQRFIFVIVMERNGIGMSRLVSESTTKQLGDWGEIQACDWLLKQGIEILHRNWRSGHKEIDIIGKDGNLLIF
ncbi:MAG: hypothetical protein EBU80_14035, partial [Chitinophagia bacterium]|nr:hypothetical protein [Chitinophagia bacterium]